MSKFIKNKSKIAVALLSTLFCNNGGVSATGKLKKNSYNIPQTSSVNLDKSSKSAQTLGAVGGVTSGNININNSNNNKIIEWVKGHKWQTATVGVLLVATAATLTFLGVKSSGEKDNGGGGGGPKPKPDQRVPSQEKNNKEQTSEQLKQIAQENMNIIYNKIGNNINNRKYFDKIKDKLNSDSIVISSIYDYRAKKAEDRFVVSERMGIKLDKVTFSHEEKLNYLKVFTDMFTGKTKLTSCELNKPNDDDDDDEVFYIDVFVNNKKYSIKFMHPFMGSTDSIELTDYENNEVMMKLTLKC